tara:strand:+ start:183 stop:374 length:192 start_codon:yes stop_codon:yes gene_type:complete
MSDSLERRIVDKLIESFEIPYPQTREVHQELLIMIAKYKSRIGKDSWMQRQYNEGKPDPMKRK